MASIGSLGEDGVPIVENSVQEGELDVFPPQGNAVVLLQMPDFVSRIDGSDGAVGVTPGMGYGHCVGRVHVGCTRIGIALDDAFVFFVVFGVFLDPNHIPLPGAGRGWCRTALWIVGLGRWLGSKHML